MADSLWSRLSMPLFDWDGLVETWPDLSDETPDQNAAPLPVSARSDGGEKTKELYPRMRRH